ncbi:MAG: thioredoxin-disulfide reductase [Candidatus Omnitrophica bacterium]|nr:thioredoxin-disulfide reductase [Candidatus Omnitrophota bacterium]
MDNKRDLIIIGAGPAGLTAALYAGRSRLDTLIIEKMATGGRILMSEAIENYPGFPGGVTTVELIGRMENQVKDLGIKFENDEVTGLDCSGSKIITSGGEYSFGALIIASGAHYRKLNVPGEKEYTGRGVSYCATCDGPFYKGKKVVLVGGGNAVAEEALYLTRFADSVSVVHRRQEMRASQILQEKMRKEKKINFILSSLVNGINGGKSVESVRIKDLLGGGEIDFACDGVFVCVGYEPETQFLKGKIDMDEAGFIITDEAMLTSAEGVFACGDCRKKSLYQVINACGDGAVAADSAYKFIADRSR